MTEIEIHQGGSLALSDEQSFWNEKQIAALRHMGVENASEGDLTVFHHVCTRTGLDPFARQIYMIGRWSREGTKYTIQTGIDGFRLIGRRAADRAGHSVSVSAPEWAHEDGSWRPVWVAAWGRPVAARVTIKRAGEPFVAVALFDEYKQTKRDGDLTQMWSQRPAGQIAKCAEALAWRMAFPQDLSGIYADEEMGQADRNEAQVQPATTSATAADRMAAALGTAPARETPEGGTRPNPAPGEPAALNVRSALAKRMFAAMNEQGITERDDRLAYVSSVVGRQVASSGEMTEADAHDVIAALAALPVDAEVVEDAPE